MTHRTDATLLLVNQSSRQGQALEIAALEEALGSPAQPVSTVLADNYKGLLDKARQAIADRAPGRIVVAGGDGTVSGFLDLALEADVPYGIIPCGTANDFAKSVDIPVDSEDAIAVVVAGHTRAVDVGFVNGISFLNAVGLGLGTQVTESLEQDSKKAWGTLAYAKCLREAVLRRKSFTIGLTVDGRRSRERVLQVTVTNGERYGGGFSAPEGASVSDGCLHVLRVYPQSLMRLLLLFPQMLLGKFTETERIGITACENAQVYSRRKLAVSVDGELLTQLPCEFSVRPGALRVFTPAETESPV